jgi:hypothetical protein
MYLIIFDYFCRVEGVVSTFAGSGTSSWADGMGIAAGFGNPFGLCINTLGKIFVADTLGLIRSIDTAGMLEAVALLLLSISSLS